MLSDGRPGLVAAPPPFGARPRGSEEILRSAFHRSPSGMSISELGGKWLEVNDAYCRMGGYDRGELLRGSYRAITHRDDMLVDAEFVAAALEGIACRLEGGKGYVRKDGSTVWAHVRVEAIRDGEGNPLYFVSHATDATERREEQSLFDDNERMLRAVI